jgi:hypothetical protein
MLESSVDWGLNAEHRHSELTEGLIEEFIARRRVRYVAFRADVDDRGTALEFLQEQEVPS